MNQNLTRKQFLRNGTKYVAGIAVGAAALNAMDLKPLQAFTKTAAWPYPYAELDIEAVRIAAHDAFWSGKGCSYGAFYGIMFELRKQIGEPWDSFPPEIMIYGHGGGAGWGATCGTINGAAALISLVSEKATSDKLVNELYGWYTQVMLPTDTSNQLGVDSGYGENKVTEALPQNESGSPLCHASVTMWCDTAKKKVGDLERKERCARVTGDTAAYAAYLLNENLLGEFNPMYVVPQEVTDCMACHGNGMNDNVAAKMECETCHGDPHATSGITQLGGAALGFSLSQNYPNPFNPKTTIKFALPKSENVYLYIYDSHGRLMNTLVNGENMAAGSYEVTWNGINDFGQTLSSGTYFARIKAGQFEKTRKMILAK
ncbi:C-GCAxxG-C-C family protein [bacterium]|nr:C-GCAxxG-C-C family protein [bacterium]